MSQAYDEGADPQAAAPPPPPRRSRALVTTAVVLVVAFFALTTFASFYTDRLWYGSVGFQSVFTRLLVTKVGLFAVFGLLMALVVGVNVVVAYRTRPMFRPGTPEQTGLDRYREAVTPIRVWLLAATCLVLGGFAGTSGAGAWRTYLLWRHSQTFGSEDAYFGRDLGFFVFDLPWWHYLTDFAMALMVVSIIAAAVVHYLYGGIRLQASRDRLSGPAQTQLSVLLGLFVLAKAGDYYLDRFDLVTRSNSRFTGMNYTGENAVLPAKEILLGVAVICAVLFFLNVWRRTWLLPSVGLALLALSAVLLGLIWPGIVQQFQVKPSEADKEESYIAANIAATRTAYDVDDVEVVPYTNESDPAEAQKAALGQQTQTVPLVDPQLVKQTFEQNQQARAYYSVADVLDVDRYEIGGADRALVLGVRELDQSGIQEGDRSWGNLHTVYTHGNGIIAAFANQRNEANTVESLETQWAEGKGTDSGPEDALTRATGGFEGRVYFGEKSPDYSVVGRRDDESPVELDLSTVGADDEVQDDTTTYDGAGGVEVGSTLRKLMYAVKFGEPNFVLSERVNENSKVLYDRTPRERVEKVAPWLSIDSDPYPIVADGRILWVIDGYTTTDRYPNAERESFEEMTDDALQEETGLRTLPTDEISYMRNAVKATVDAYDGTVTLYAWDETDPILRAWRSAFPGTIEPREAIPDEVLDHLRYPEDLFKVQRYQYARYHVTDPGDFFQGNDRWSVPSDPNNSRFLQPPYRLFVNDPESETAQWSLTSVFVPRNRDNLAAVAAVNSDATSPDYGKLRVLQLTNTRTQGPGLIANEFNSSEKVRSALLPFQTSNSAPPLFGNLLTLPVRDGLIYVEPVYQTRAGTDGSFPILTKLVISYGDSVGIGDTLTDAIASALGVSGEGTEGTGTGEGPSAEPSAGPSGGPSASPSGGPSASPSGGPSGSPTAEPTGSLDDRIRAALRQAEAAFAAADQALAAGDLAEYQQQIELAQQYVQDALDLAAKRDGGS